MLPDKEKMLRKKAEFGTKVFSLSLDYGNERINHIIKSLEPVYSILKDSLAYGENCELSQLDFMKDCFDNSGIFKSK